MSTSNQSCGGVCSASTYWHLRSTLQTAGRQAEGVGLIGEREAEYLQGQSRDAGRLVM